MAYGQNLQGKQPRASFQTAGGCTVKFKHPYLIGQLSASAIDTVDLSASVKLDGTFFQATPNQDSAYQTVLIDGSTVTITNTMTNGTITIPVIPTTGIVGTGDAIACFQLIQSIGDSVGGVLYTQKEFGGKLVTRIYYGVAIKNVPHEIDMGMAVPEYSCQLLYSGYIVAVSDEVTDTAKIIQAAGNIKGVEASFTPYYVQNADGDTGTASTAPSAVNANITGLSSYGVNSNAGDSIDTGKTDGVSSLKPATDVNAQKSGS